jgi:hypothetical protein
MRRQKTEAPRPMPSRLWTVTETAEFLGVPVSTLYYWSYRGRADHGSCGSVAC